MTGFTHAFRTACTAYADLPAIREGDRELTYAELAGLADGYRDACLAAGLRRGQVVVLKRERGIEATAAMIGILLAGGAYTVIGDNYPAHRLEAMMTALDVAFVLDDTWPPALGVFANGADVDRSGDDLMYVIFTSGTTSVPKAVGVPDRAVLRLRDDPRLGLIPGDRITHVSPIEFDASVVELWGGLLAGMTVVCVPTKQLLDPFVMFDLIANGADVMWLTSSLFNFFVDKRPEAFAGLKRVIVGGEALSLPHVNKALPHVTVVNGYGPTENTVFTTLDVMNTSSVTEISIGSAVAGTEIAVRGADGRRATEGELLALGDGLALGYINDPDKTAASFIDFEGRRAYRTGDYVRLNPDGRLTYTGRIDSQVKINGYRIDLQEVENAFLECGAGQAKAFVEDGKINIAVTNGGERLRDAIAAYLPAYMQPRSILLVERIPLTPNGKADVAALRTQLSGPPAAAPAIAESSAPASVRDIVAEHASDPIEDTDNLFELGFDSIGLWKLINATNDAFGTSLTLFDVLAEPSLDHLERLVAV